MEEMIAAIKADNLKVTEQFNRSNVNIILNTETQYTALHYAIKYSSVKVIKYLLSIGASVYYKKTIDGKSAVDLAIDFKNDFFLNSIISREKDITARCVERINKLISDNNKLNEYNNKLNENNKNLKNALNAIHVNALNAINTSCLVHGNACPRRSSEISESSTNSNTFFSLLPPPIQPVRSYDIGSMFDARLSTDNYETQPNTARSMFDNKENINSSSSSSSSSSTIRVQNPLFNSVLNPVLNETSVQNNSTDLITPTPRKRARSSRNNL